MNRTEEIKQGCLKWYWYDDDQYQCIPSELCPSCLARLDERQRALNEFIIIYEQASEICEMAEFITKFKAELGEKE
jgi:hypothetical protein